MKVNNGNIHTLYVNSYKTKENAKSENSNVNKEAVKDTCQLSALGKSLNKLALEEESVGMSDKEVEKIKSRISKGTYTVDSQVLAKAMMAYGKGGQ
ncbi:flagellar biosynthesis anti-sigma factor FlgM [Clostridium sp.]|uniref:flagellar biosynthesis anti-sigma factor FlgM n=1 Tax=Clostridium sp. TaxID=1506 RepID=UPI003217B64B